MPSWRRLWALAFLVASVLGVSTVLFVYFGMMAGGRPLTFRTALLAGLPDWYFWAALTPAVFWLGQRFRFSRHAWLRATLIHLAAGVVVALVELLLYTTFNHWFYYNPWAPAPADFSEAYSRNVLRSFHFAFIIYWLIVAAAHAFAYYREYQRRALETSRLSAANAELAARLSHAQLEALRAQLHPHFLFNALNTVSGFVRAGRSAEATELVARLGDLLRRSLAGSDRNQVELREELEFVDAYLTIERARFADRLDVVYDVDTRTLDARVPAMLLQPLVENAIRHGLRQASSGRVWIRARQDDGDIQFEVADNGAGLGGEEPSAGVGLANLRARLERMYGAGYRLEMDTESSRENGGDEPRFSVRIRIPA